MKAHLVCLLAVLFLASLLVVGYLQIRSVRRQAQADHIEWAKTQLTPLRNRFDNQTATMTDVETLFAMIKNGSDDQRVSCCGIVDLIRLKYDYQHPFRQRMAELLRTIELDRDKHADSFLLTMRTQLTFKNERERKDVSNEEKR